MDLITRSEIVFSNYTDASVAMEILLRNDYVCMLSMEDDSYVLNYEWEPCCNRNGVVFINRDYFDAHWCCIENEDEDVETEDKNKNDEEDDNCKVYKEYTKSNITNVTGFAGGFDDYA